MPKILWMSPFSLHDTSSGAAVNCHYMMRALQKRGFEVWVCSAFIFDARRGSTQAFGDLEKMFAQDPTAVFVFDEDNIHYVYTRADSTDEYAMTMAESQLFFNTFCRMLDEFEPDVVMGFGLSPAPQACFAEARHRGISTVYELSNGDCGNFSFPNIDLITTISGANSQLYADRDELNLQPIGGFYSPKDFVADEHQNRYVTMINPAGHKGVAIFAKLAAMCKERMPEVQFLTVNTRENFSEAVLKLHEKSAPDKHPFKAEDFPNVFMVEPQLDMRAIYAITAVLLVPSLWFEAWGRVATEAVYNNIPVIAANSGGLNEAVAGGGILLNAPEHCKQDYYSLPTDEEIKPWFEALQYFLNHNVDALLQRAREQLMQADAPDRLISALIPLVRRTRHNRYGDGFDPNAHVGDLNNLEDAELADIDFS